MRISGSVLLLATVLLSSCGDSGKPSGTSTVTTVVKAPAPAPNPETSIGKDATDKLMDILAAYYSLKDALVASDGAKADNAAARLMSTAERFHADMPSVPAATQRELLPQLQIIMDGSEGITKSKAEAIEDKRKQFAVVSDAVYQVAKIADLKHAGVYHQFCPMAMNDKGAYWLSANSEIKNPYYGNKMLECGEVKDSL